MASVDVSLKNAYFEDVKRFRIVKGESGTLILNRTSDDYAGDTDYAATGDPVLDLMRDPNFDNVDFTAKQVGVSRFFFIQKSDTEFSIIRQLRIEVVERIGDSATNLNASGEPIDKEL